MLNPSIEGLNEPSGQPQNAWAMKETAVHRMARFSESHGDEFSHSPEDRTAVTDDELAPGISTHG